ncbi:MAG: hypothetical protein L0170_17695, partial [Acidobacteria bacterium]|nr:hypothetical protein [Acidobacteriota bacterium]
GDGGTESSIEVATLQALLLCVLIPLAWPVPGVLVPSFLRSFRQSRWVPAASTLYLLLAGSLVVTLSALPVVVFYRSAYDSEMEIFVKHAQLGLAREIATRNESVRQEYGKVPAALESGYLEGRLEASGDIYDIPLVRDEQAGQRGLHAGKSVEDVKQDGRCVFDAHPFEKALRAVRPLYNDTAVQTHELVYDRSADCSVQWKETREGVIFLQSERTGMKNLPQGSKVPLLAQPSTPGSWLGLMSALLVLFVLIGLLVKWVVRRLFWIDLLEAAGAEVTDLDRVGESDDPARKEDAISEADLEAGIAAANLREDCKRALREECSRTSWLRRIGMDILAQPDASGLDARRLVADVLDRARAFYHSLWRGCSQEERLLLFDLAEDGFVNAKGDVRRRLIERGLVVRGSQLRLVNESFQAFIVEMGRAGNIHAAQEGARNPQRMMRMILGTGVVAIAFIVFLTQPQLWNLSTTFIGAVGAGIPSMMALLNMLHGRRAQR